jgi:hypothetical protein
MAGSPAQARVQRCGKSAPAASRGAGSVNPGWEQGLGTTVGHETRSAFLIEVGDGAAIRANTGSISLDRTVYPVPWGVTADVTDATVSASSTPNGRSVFPIHQTGMAATTAIAADEYLANGDLTIHVRVNDPDYDVSATGEDKIATVLVNHLAQHYHGFLLKQEHTLLLPSFGNLLIIQRLYHHQLVQLST